MPHIPASLPEAPLTEATTYVLVCLAGQPNHGYGIIKLVSALSDGRIWFTAGTLYGVVKRLLELGWIERQDDPEGVREESGRSRKVYRLTATGKCVLRAEAERLEQLARVAQTYLSEAA